MQGRKTDAEAEAVSKQNRGMACRSPGRRSIRDGRPKQHGRQKKEGESPVGREQGHAGRRCASRGREQEAMRFVLYGGLGSGKLMGKEKRIVFFNQS
jgi:hypothetical protein